MYLLRAGVESGIAVLADRAADVGMDEADSRNYCCDVGNVGPCEENGGGGIAYSVSDGCNATGGEDPICHSVLDHLFLRIKTL